MRSFGIKSAVLTLVLLAIAACTTLNAAPVQPIGQSWSSSLPYAQHDNNRDRGW